MARSILVTGASRYLGGRMAALLAEDPDTRVIGIDVVPPEAPLAGVEFVRADIRAPGLARLMGQAEVDTVVHMGVIATPIQAGGRSTMKEINVIGTMQLLAACQATPSVRSLIVKSSSAVYGSGPGDPAMFTEEMEPRDAPASGWGKDSREVEGYVRAFARRRPEVAVTTLRFANFIGPRIVTAMTEYLSLPVVPTVLGFDPRLQFVHEDDGLAAIRRVVAEQAPGTFNVAGPGAVTLSQCIRRAGGRALPMPAIAVPSAGRLVARTRWVDFSGEQVRFISYGRVLDTGRMERAYGWRPQWSTAEAFDAFAAARGAGR